MIDEQQIERAILGHISGGPEAEQRVVALVARDLDVPTNLVHSVAGRLSREGRLLVRCQGRGGAPSSIPMWHAPGEQVRPADQAAVEVAIAEAIERIARESGVARPIVAQIVGRVASRLIAQGS